jgi:hypothetical protein
MSLAKYINRNPLMVLISVSATIGSFEYGIFNSIYSQKLEAATSERADNSSGTVKINFDVGERGVVLTEDKISAHPSELQGYKMLSSGRIAVIDPKNAQGWEWSKKTELDLIMGGSRSMPVAGKDDLRKFRSFEADVFSRKKPVTVTTEDGTYTYRPMATFEFVEWDQLQLVNETYQRAANVRIAQMFFQGAVDSAQRGCLKDNTISECELQTKNRWPSLIDDRDRYLESLNRKIVRPSKLEYMASLFWRSVLPLDAQSLGPFIPQQTSFDKNSMIVEGYYDLARFKTTGGTTKLYVMNLFFALDSGLYVASYTLPFSELNRDPAMLRALFASFKIVK